MHVMQATFKGLSEVAGTGISYRMSGIHKPAGRRSATIFMLVWQAYTRAACELYVENCIPC